MKKSVAVLTASVLALSLAGCGNAASSSASSYADFEKAAVDDEVTVEAYVQGHQSWWDGKISVYLQDKEGGYFAYNMACSEEDAAKLTEGTKIRVTGYKAEWAGEVEIAEGATFEFAGNDTYIAPATDVTAYIGSDEMDKYINQRVAFKDMTVVSVNYKNNEPGDDIYVTLNKDGVDVNFCLEYYLNGSDADFYNLVGSLEEGAVVDVECFLYYYEGPDGHLTAVTVK